MNQKCLQSFSNLFGYDQHHTHATNVNTLCANLTMRREIVVTRRAGVTTSVITRITPSKGEHRLIAHELKRTLAVDWQADLIYIKISGEGDENQKKKEEFGRY